MFKVNNKDTVHVSLFLTLNIFPPCSINSIVNFEHVNARWVAISPGNNHAPFHLQQKNDKISNVNNSHTLAEKHFIFLKNVSEQTLKSFNMKFRTQ